MSIYNFLRRFILHITSYVVGFKLRLFSTIVENRRSLGALALVVLVTIIYAFYQFFVPIHPKNDKFAVNRGESVKTITSNLNQQGFIKSKALFKTYLVLSGAANKIQAGEYDFSKAKNMKNVAEILIREAKAPEIVITLPEGVTVKEIGAWLQGHGLEFQAVTLEPGSNLEGYLFPDTYRIYKNTTLNDILQKMRKNFDQKITPQMLSDIKKQGKTLKEVVILASIIEKEVSSDTDRKLVSDIFWRRLDNGIALQADSTLNYLTGRKSRALSQEELAIDSPYNTYKYRGLPPTPISNPGLSAILAAIYSKKNDYLYFLSKKDGTIIFSRTFQEHVRAKLKTSQATPSKSH